MWTTFDRAKHPTSRPTVSVTDRGLAVSKGAILLIMDELPAHDLSLETLTNDRQKRVGIRLVGDRTNASSLLFMRPRTGAKQADGKRKYVNTWIVRSSALVRQSGLSAGVYLASLEDDMIVFGPETWKK